MSEAETVSKQEVIPFCTACLHFRRDFWGFWSQEFARCARPELQLGRFFVDGSKKAMPYCESLRTPFTGKCGRTGIFFELAE